VLATWVLIKNVYDRKIKGKRRKRDSKTGITTLGSSNDDNRHSICWWQAHTRLFARVCFITRSLPLVAPLGDFYGNSSRNFMIFCAGTSEARTSQWVFRRSQAPSSNERCMSSAQIWVRHIGTWSCASSDPPSRPVLPYSLFTVWCCWADPHCRWAPSCPLRTAV